MTRTYTAALAELPTPELEREAVAAMLAVEDRVGVEGDLAAAKRDPRWRACSAELARRDDFSTSSHRRSTP